MTKCKTFDIKYTSQSNNKKYIKRLSKSYLNDILERPYFKLTSRKSIGQISNKNWEVEINQKLFDLLKINIKYLGNMSDYMNQVWESILDFNWMSSIN